MSKTVSKEEIELRKKNSIDLDNALKEKADLTPFYPKNYNALKGKIIAGSLSKEEATKLYDHFENLGAVGTSKRLLIENFLQNVNKEIGGNKDSLHKFTAVLIEVDRESEKVKNDPAQLLRNVSLARNCLEFECIENEFGKNLVPIAKANNINPYDVKMAFERFEKDLKATLPKNKKQAENIETQDTITNAEKLDSFKQTLNKAKIGRKKREELKQKLNGLQNLEDQNQAAQKQLNNSINKLEMPGFLQDHYKNTIEPHFAPRPKENNTQPSIEEEQTAQKNGVYSTIFNTISVVVPKYLEQEGIKKDSIATLAFQSNIKRTDVGMQTIEASKIFHKKLGGKTPEIKTLEVIREEIPKVEPKTITSMSGPQAKSLDKASKTLGTKITEKNLEKTNKLLGIGASSNMIGKGSAKKIDKIFGEEQPLPEQPKMNIFAKAFDKIKQAVSTLKDRFTKPVIYASAKAGRQEETITKPLEAISKPNEPLSKTQATTIEKHSFKPVNELNAERKKPPKDIIKPNPELNQEQKGLSQELKDKVKKKFQPSPNQKTETKAVTKTSPPIVPKLDLVKLMQNAPPVSSNRKITPPPTPHNNTSKRSSRGGIGD